MNVKKVNISSINNMEDILIYIGDNER